MNKNFLKFVTSKGYTEASFNELEAEKQVEIQRDYLGTIEEAQKSFITNEALEAKLKGMATDDQVKALGDLINEIKDSMENKGGTEVKLSEELKSNKEVIAKIAKGEKKEIVLKANVTRASITNNTASVRLNTIGQLGVKARALYDFFTKFPVGDGNHNGTISYVDWDESTTVRAASVKAEGVAFDESTATFREYTTKLVKIGDTLPVTEEFLEDEVLAASELENFLNVNVNAVIDTKIAVGAGNGNGADVEGLYTASPAYTPVASGIVDANIKDLVRKMRTAIVKTRGSKYQPNFVAANSDVIDRYILKKDQNNNYMFDMDSGTIAGLTIVEDNNLADNTLVVGDSRFGRIYEKPGVVISEGLVNAQFTSDLKTLKARVRILFLIRNVDKTGFLKCTNINTALATLAT
jgi:hypothetical protein